MTARLIALPEQLPHCCVSWPPVIISADDLPAINSVFVTCTCRQLLLRNTNTCSVVLYPQCNVFSCITFSFVFYATISRNNILRTHSSQKSTGNLKFISVLMEKLIRVALSTSSTKCRLKLITNIVFYE